MQSWIYVVHPSRENFVQTITGEEAAIMSGDHHRHRSRRGRD